jgi:hypothetical protein
MTGQVQFVSPYQFELNHFRFSMLQAVTQRHDVSPYNWRMSSGQQKPNLKEPPKFSP